MLGALKSGTTNGHLLTAMQWKSIHDFIGFYSYAYRDMYVKNVAFPILTKEMLDKLVSFIKPLQLPVLDVCAGKGFFAKQLSYSNIHVRAIDNQSSTYHGGKHTPKHFNVEIKDSLGCLNRTGHEIILMSWPDYDKDFAFKIAKEMRSDQFLIYQGEGEGGCVANDSFFEYIDSSFTPVYDIGEFNREHSQFFGINDFWYILQKK